MSEITPTKLELNACEPESDAELAQARDHEIESKPKDKRRLIGLVAVAVVIIVAGAVTLTVLPDVMRASANGKSEDAVTLNGEGDAGEHGSGADASVKDKDATGSGIQDADKKKKKPKAKNITPPVNIGEIAHYNDKTYVVLYPHRVSVHVSGRTKQLTISLIIETNDDDAALLLDHGFHLQDQLNSILRLADGDALSDPTGSRIRGQFHRQVQEMLPDVEIENILIREFIVS